MSNNSLVVITGCAGFLGSHLINELAKKKVDVFGVDKAVEENYELNNIEVNKLDILSREGEFGLRKYFDKSKNKDIYLVHLMGISDTEGCERDKALAYDVNVKSVKTIWELAEAYGMKKVVFPSTALVYGTKYEDLISEELPPFPENTYAREKLEAENYLVSSSVGSKVTSVILRLSNIYGAGMSGNTVVNTIMRQFKEGYLRLKEYKSVRDYVYVDDVTSAFLSAIFSECKFKVYNVGSSTGYSVCELAKIIAAGTGKERIISEIKLNEEEIKNGSRLVLCCDRIKKDLKWAPSCDLECGIKGMTNA